MSQKNNLRFNDNMVLSQAEAQLSQLAQSQNITTLGEFISAFGGKHLLHYFHEAEAERDASDTLYQ